MNADLTAARARAVRHIVSLADGPYFSGVSLDDIGVRVTLRHDTYSYGFQVSWREIEYGVDLASVSQQVRHAYVRLLSVVDL